MYAIIEDKQKQYKVSPGDVVKIDLVDAAALARAEALQFDRVLLICDGEKVTVGTPLVAGAKVLADLVDPVVKGKKVRAFKFKRRKGYHRDMGHRQKYTQVRITEIVE